MVDFSIDQSRLAEDLTEQNVVRWAARRTGKVEQPKGDEGAVVTERELGCGSRSERCRNRGYQSLAGQQSGGAGEDLHDRQPDGGSRRAAKASVNVEPRPAVVGSSWWTQSVSVPRPDRLTLIVSSFRLWPSPQGHSRTDPSATEGSISSAIRNEKILLHTDSFDSASSPRCSEDRSERFVRPPLLLPPVG